jgi:hypothetical protein
MAPTARRRQVERLETSLAMSRKYSSHSGRAIRETFPILDFGFWIKEKDKNTRTKPFQFWILVPRRAGLDFGLTPLTAKARRTQRKT